MFVALNAFGTAARLLLIRQFGNIFGGQISSFSGWITEYRIPIFIVSALLIGWTIYREFGGENSEVKSLIDLERHPEADADLGESTTDDATNDGASSDEAPPA